MHQGYTESWEPLQRGAEPEWSCPLCIPSFLCSVFEGWLCSDLSSQCVCVGVGWAVGRGAQQDCCQGLTMAIPGNPPSLRADQIPVGNCGRHRNLNCCLPCRFPFKSFLSQSSLSGSADPQAPHHIHSAVCVSPLCP